MDHSQIQQLVSPKFPDRNLKLKKPNESKVKFPQKLRKKKKVQLSSIERLRIAINWMTENLHQPISQHLQLRIEKQQMCH